MSIADQPSDSLLAGMATAKEGVGGDADREHGAVGHRRVEAALRYQHSQDGKDAIVAAN